MPKASFDEVCNHFRKNYAPRCVTEETLGPDIQEDEIDEAKWGPKWKWCIVIDDEVLKSLEDGPGPIGDTPPEGVDPFRLAFNSFKVLVKLLLADYTTMEKPVQLTTKSRQGTGGIQWNGWFKFSLVDLRVVFRETDEGEIETFFKGENEYLGF